MREREKENTIWCRNGKDRLSGSLQARDTCDPVTCFEL